MYPYPFGMDYVVGERGQVTIPKDLREAIGLRPGDRVRFTMTGGSIALTPVDDDPFRALIGVVRSDRSVDELMEELRGPVPPAVRSRPPRAS